MNNFNNLRQSVLLILFFNSICFIIANTINNNIIINNIDRDNNNSKDNYYSSNNNNNNNNNEQILDGINIWNNRDSYYYKQLHMKMKHLIIHGNCSSNFIQIEDNIIKIPHNRDDIFISIFPIDKNIELYWRNIMKPKQHRVDPYICEVVYQRKKLPIFNNTR